ncbi:MAG: acetyl-CoA carboxylase biotin carboxylase subunit [bacterium]|nr:acetyl-CoA carboxylase biotin carboxylase subunit [bacterium]
MINKILIANRGEIALRIIRACKELGIMSVAVFSEADRDSLHVRFADEAICIGAAPSSESYLNIPRILGAAEISNVDAIHPGYGFLAENPTFAEICKTNEFKFIGPDSEVIQAMGNKVVAKKTMMDAGVPVIPGSEGVVSGPEEAESIAKEMGFPVILKASAGGGGKGMRIVFEADQVQKQFKLAQNEAIANFGNGDIYIEKFFVNPRHIEIQILADDHGNVVHLGERDCSVQRRHQKLIEESPSPGITPEIRKKMGDTAIKGTREAKYTNAGTIEFLVTESGEFYFMEMNTRIQVEHPVTEMVYGVDLIKEQIMIASEGKMSITQDDIILKGNAVECRVNAEDPDKKFRPSAGQITSFHLPGGPGIRVDTHAYASYTVPPTYDSLLAKLITHGNTREEALLRMNRALEEFIIEGINTTIPFHLKVINTDRFKNGNYHTGLLEEIQNGL